MIPKKRQQQIFLGLCLLTLIYILFRRNQGSGDIPRILRVVDTASDDQTDPQRQDGQDRTAYTHQLSNSFHLGISKPRGYNYTKTLIIPHIKTEDVSWVEENFGYQAVDGGLQISIYSADDASAPLHPPKNKGHEVMVYLTYIIDHYNALSDVNIFMHSHQNAWHNNEILNNSAVEMITRLSAERVQREGYMNLRCHWIPGCPDWMHPKASHESYGKKEEAVLAKSWSELFPLDPIPDVLAQPCCSQFAISGDRLRSIPLERFVFYRDWLLRTSLSDYLSGRVWEYIWQFVFTGHNVNCSAEHVCYCDGYGVCFGDENAYKDWWKLWEQKRISSEELRVWREHTAEIQRAMKESKLDEVGRLDIPEIGRDIQLEEEIAALTSEMNQRTRVAIERGLDPKNRASEVGRTWHDGNGF